MICFAWGAIYLIFVVLVAFRVRVRVTSTNKFKMCGIFGYVNYLVERDRKFITNILLTGLSRLEYRGYDSAGIACDGDKEGEVNCRRYC